jgi:SAM-dependent methyltransferase
VLNRAEIGGYSASLIPPDEQTKGDIGPGDFRAVGEQFLGHFRQLANLAPSNRVLDVGCGSGRMAAPLTIFLDPLAGSYEGFDVTEGGVEWCQAAYAAYPNFQFRHAAVRSDFYETEGVPAEGYRFPYEDGEFDFVILTSIFTHLLPKVVNHYLDEIVRVLRDGGVCFATWFLLDAHALQAALYTPEALKFRSFRRGGPAWVVDPAHPEAVTAYELDHVVDLYAERGFRVEVHRGRWPFVYRVLMPDAKSYQDIVVARK